MSAPRLRALLLCAVAALGTAGCALTSKSDPILPRYFSPDRPSEVAGPGARVPGTPPELRLGRIDGSDHLEERIVFRDSEYELGYYAERRWTEAPEEYLKRRLSRVLFEERGLQRVVNGRAPTLEVQLTAFEEIRKPKRVARVQVIVRLHDQRIVRWEETLTVNQPIAEKDDAEDPDAMVEAVGLALRAVVDRIADRIVRELAAPAGGSEPVTGE